ncbi:MAG: glycosyltransferase family 4 protein [Candidatus Eisenbacteria bacterium]|nr:glycosyltransferase family 4 protein [Candidatus Eisenbacteria bacterium]
MTDAERITVTLYSDAAYYGGAEVYLSLLARHLDPRRFRLTALLPKDPTVPRLEEEIRAAGGEVFHHARPGFHYRASLPELRAVLKQIGGTVLHINLPSTYDAGVGLVALAARLAGYRRVVSTEHLPMIPRRYRKFPLKILFGEAIDRIIVPARATRSYVVELHRMPAEKTRILPYGVEEPAPVPDEEARALREATGTRPGDVVAGIVGRLTERKGHRFLFQTLAILRREGKLPGNLRLWVIGEGEEREALEQDARRRELSEIVRFVGPRADAAALMALLDLLVVPSLVETTPFVVLEAMAAGRPVVASAIYGIPEMIEDGRSGRLVPPADPEALARALEEPLAGGPDLRARWGRRARELYEERFAAPVMARGTEAIYLGLDGERAS